MDVSPFVDSLRHDLAAAASAGDDRVRDAAERLSRALDPALRMTLIEVLGQAAAEITTELHAGSVELRLRGRDPEFVVDLPAADAPAAPLPPSPPTTPRPDDLDESDGATARITLRLPEPLKQRAEEIAAEAGQSLNAWIVAAVRSASGRGAVNVDIDLSSLLMGGDRPHRSRGGPRRMTGWV